MDGWAMGQLISPEDLRARPGTDGAGVSPRTLASSGSLEVIVAGTPAEIRAAQALRFEVFFEEGGAQAAAYQMLERRDCDPFDPFCDHLIVIDHALPEARRVVGTYRLLAPEAARRAGGYYSAGEFEIAALIARRPDMNVLELGRSCVRRSHRDRRTLELLWAGIWAMVRATDADILIGCASFEGTDPEIHAEPLSFLHHHCRASGDFAVGALPHRHVAMDMMAAGDIDTRRALRALPPLIKGYLNLGARVGEGAVIDRDFGTTDVLVMLDRAQIQARYKRRFGADTRDAA